MNCEVESAGGGDNAITTDWKLCVLCQKDTQEKLIQPHKTGQTAGSQTLSNNLLMFHEIGAVPFNINIEQLAKLDNGDGLQDTFTTKKAVWHRTCYSLCSTEKVARARKRIAATGANSSNACPSPVKTRKKQGINPNVSVCFFCEKYTKESLHKAQTFNINSRVYQYALKLRDTKLLAKLASGDMTAIDAEYHLSCLTALGNKVRSLERSQNQQTCESVDGIVFAELLSYMEDVYADDDLPVFKLSNLVKLYSARKEQLGGDTTVRVNSTWLKERLLYHIPDLRAQSQGREVLLIRDKDIGQAVNIACTQNKDSDAIHLLRTAQIIRKEIFKKNYEFTGSFDEKCEEDAVPQALKALIRMVLQGSNIKDQTHTNNNITKTRAVLSLSELIMFNCVKKASTDHEASCARHSKDRESPLPIYLSLLTHAQTRTRDNVDKMYNLGLCISYDRMMSISADLANSVCAQYQDIDLVCPPKLMRDVFTTGAVDNIDHNPTSTTAKDSFHGTAISMMQFPATDMPGISREQQFVTSNDKTLTALPVSYTLVPPATIQNKELIAPALHQDVTPRTDMLAEAMEQEFTWLETSATLIKKDKLQSNDYVSWSAHHASHQPDGGTPRMRTNVALLPLFRENASSVAMILHTMNILVKTTRHLNPGQIPVLVMDQPLYAIAKSIQWNMPATHGEDHIVVLLGGLHIEMNLLKMLGDVLVGSGWRSSLVQAEVTTDGRAQAIEKAAHVTRTRYAHQVTAVCLYILQTDAYNQYKESEQNSMEFADWCKHQSDLHPQFKYWAMILNLELQVLQFIRSLREGNFALYVQTLNQITPWLFALDHTNYARWLPVHIYDMISLATRHPLVYGEFMKGHFVVNKSGKKFSTIAMDQAHEQVNELIKGDGGAVGLTENAQALHRWMVAGPEVSRVISEFQNSFKEQQQQQQKNRHHEQVPGVQRNFAKHVNALITVFQEMGNPFTEESSDLVTLDTKDVMNESVVESLTRIQDIGVQQYRHFVDERIKNRTTPITDTIKKNKLPLFSSSTARVKTKLTGKVSVLKNDCALFSRLYIACQSRNGQLDEFFEHENQAAPPSLSDRGSLRHGTKSDLLDCLDTCAHSTAISPQVDAKVLDGPAIVHMLQPGASKTFHAYAEDVFIPYVNTQLDSVKRIDVIWDRYLSGSLKRSVRDARGTGIQRRVSPQAPIPMNWHNFLSVDENKTGLFLLLAKYIADVEREGKSLYTTSEEMVLSSQGNVDESIQPCTHEEADTRILLHVSHCARMGHKRVSIRTVDTDVVVIAVASFQFLDLDELWVAFGVGKNYRFIPIHAIATSLGAPKSRALLAFHALTGCDTVSAFSGHGKKSAWETWKVCPAVTPSFLNIASQPTNVSNDVMDELERFVVVLYSRTCPLSKVNEARKRLFSQGARAIENIPPTQAALLQHVKRAAYQSGHCWSQALTSCPELPSPGQWGWWKDGSDWRPHWTDLPEASKSCSELIRCGCKKGCSRRCKCRSSNLRCTELCFCHGGCPQE